MSNVSSNMVSKHYCPQCDSFDLIKLHRSFVEKRILGSENKLQCRDCGETIKRKSFEENIPREVPIFIESQNAIVDPAISAAQVPDFDINTVSDLTPEDAIHPQAMPPAFEEGFDLPEMNTRPNQAPPQSTGSELLIDETILIKEKQGIWPYVTASLLVIFGTVYAFIWMPMSLSAQEADTTQIDMTIGKPLQTVSSSPISEANLKVVEEVTLPVVAKVSLYPEGKDENADLSKLILPTEEAISVPAEIKTTVLKEAQIDLPEAPKTKPHTSNLEKPIEKLTPEKINIEPKPRQAIALKIPNPRLIPDLGTKADNALGGLSRASSPVDSELLVDVPLPKTSIRQYVVINTDEGSTESTDPEVKIADIKAPIEAAKAVIESATIAVVSDNSPVQEVSKKQAIIEEPVKDQARTSSTAIETQQPTKAVAAIEAQQPTKAVAVIEAQLPTKAVAATETKQPTKTITVNKRAAALLGVSAADLSTLVSTKSVQPSKVTEKKPVVQKIAKGQIADATTTLLENVAVKFMEQDLDKLLPN